MSESSLVEGADSLQGNASSMCDNKNTLLPFDRISPDQYPAFVREHNSTLSFPEKLIMMLMHIEYMCVSVGRNPQEEAIHWTKSGDAFVVRDEKRLSDVWLRVFFGNTLYSSFTRKMYRWGFHKISPAVYQYDRGEVTIFGSINFHRDKKHLLLLMESQTAAKQRRTLVAKQRKIKYQHILRNKVVAKASDTPAVSKVHKKEIISTPLINGRNEGVQEAARLRTIAPSFPIQQPRLDTCSNNSLNTIQLQKALCLANFLCESGLGTVSNTQRLVEQDAAQSRFGSVLHVNHAQNSMQNQSSLVMQLLEERIMQQKAQYGQMHMQALATIIRNRFAQE